MIEWLEGKGISYPPKALRSEIFSIIQGEGVTPHYVMDEMAHAAGHKVPVPHCTLNPIELAWAQVKGHIKANTHEFNLAEVEHLAWDGFKVVTPKRWASLVRYVREKVEDHVDRLPEQYSECELTFCASSDSVSEEYSSEGGTTSRPLTLILWLMTMM